MESIRVMKAKYLKNYQLEVFFSDNSTNAIDFEQQIKNIKVPEYKKYQKLEQFKQFTVENGNLVWGRDWDLIFPVHELHEGQLKITSSDKNSNNG